MQRQTFFREKWFGKEAARRGDRRSEVFFCLALAALVVFGGCNSGGGIVLESCILEEEGCPEGYVCQATAASSTKGICVPKAPFPEGSCALDDDSTCPPGQLCWESAEAPPGRGTCVPEDGCLLEASMCPEGQGCWPVAGLPPELGACFPEGTCALGQAECEVGEVCWAAGDKPEGLGTCVPSNSCTLEDNSWPCMQPDNICQETPAMPPGLGTCVPTSCVPDDDSTCPQEWVCWEAPDALPGQGTCVPEDSCTLDDNTWPCETDMQCWETAHTPPGLGTCLPENTCTLEEGGECEENEVCTAVEKMPSGLGICEVGESSEVACTPGGEGEECEAGEVCRPTGEDEGDEGKCVREICALPPFVPPPPLPPASFSPSPECPSGWLCLPTENTSPGFGTCLPGNTCILEESGACEADEVCNEAEGMPADLGICEPKGTIGESCTLSGGTECSAGETCRPAGEAPAGSTQGICVPETCTPGETSKCPTGTVCQTVGAQDTCLPTDACTLEETGACIYGEVCQPTAGMPQGLGTCDEQSCTPGSHGECPSGAVCLEEGICAEHGCTLNNHAQCPSGSVCLDTEMCAEQSCVPGSPGECPSGAVCLEEEICAPIVCIPGEEGVCGEGEVCWPTEDGRGECLPENSCTLEEGEECAPNEICSEASGLPEGIGSCTTGESSEEACNPSGDGSECEAGEACRPSEDGGVCVREVCTIDTAVECPSTGWTCMESTESLEGFGTCVPEDTCTIEGNVGCELNEICQTESGLPADLGSCTPGESSESECTLGEGSECEAGEACRPSEDGGICVREVCTPATSVECPSTGWTCMESTESLEGFGTCVPEDTCTLEGNVGCELNELCNATSEIPSGLGSCEVSTSSGEACNTSGENACEASGEICRPTEDGGVCVKAFCALSGETEDECPEEWLCLEAEDSPTDFGTCVPAGSCTATGDECALNEICGEANELPEGIGTCEAGESSGAACTLGDGSECEAGEACRPSSSGGICVREVCTLDTSAECPSTGWACMESTESLEGFGTCVPEDTCTIEGNVGCEPNEICSVASEIPSGLGNCEVSTSSGEACNTSGENACEASGEICRPTEDGGVCVKAFCALSGETEDECPADWLCLEAEDSPNGFGTCVPAGSCTETGDECALNEICGEANELPNGIGTCEAGESSGAACTLGDGSECDAGEACRPSSSGGICVREVCTPATSVECPSTGWACMESTESPEGFGTCVPEDTCTLEGNVGCEPNEICNAASEIPSGLGSCEVSTSSGEACNTSGENACEASGEICRPTEDGGVCVKAFCALSGETEDECPADWLCLEATDSPTGFGTCVPAGSCTATGDECALNEICGEANELPEGIGTCAAGESSESECTLDGGECGEGEACRPTGDGGICVREVCTPATSSECPEDWLCLEAEDSPAGFGTCVSSGSCTMGAEENESECAEGYACWETANLPEGLGTCVPTDTCTLSGGTECSESQTCWDTGDRPTGLGACVSNDSCTPESTDWACAETDEICWPTGDKPGGLGTCVPLNTCTLSGGTECALNEVCNTSDGMPEGLGLCAAGESSGEACDSSGDGSECDAGEACRPSEDGGVCVREVCTIDTAVECPSTGWTCMESTGSPSGFGTCVPEDTCTLEGNVGCAANEICQAANGLPTDLGSCTPGESSESECTLGDGSECDAGEACRPSSSGGICVREVCTLDTSAECPSTGWTCMESTESPEGFGTCVPEGTCTLEGNVGCEPNEICNAASEIPSGLGSCEVSTSSGEACNTSGENACEASGEICRPTEDGGVCVKAFCALSGETEDECPADWLCLEAEDSPTDFGTCVPAGSCTETGDECALNEICGEANELPEGIGTCETGQSSGAVCIPSEGENACTATGETCRPTGENSGTCVREVCTPATSAECPSTWLCLEATGSPNGFGTCVPAGSCTETGDECALNEICDEANALPNGIGSCTPGESSEVACALGGGSECGVGEVCRPAEGGGICVREVCTPATSVECPSTGWMCWEGAGGFGTCVPEGSCTLEPGEEEGECAEGDICIDLENGLPSGLGTCLQSPRVEEWTLFQEEEAVDAGGWLGPWAGVVEVRTSGHGSDEGLRVWTGEEEAEDEEATCVGVQSLEGGQHAWECTFEEGFVGAGPEVVVWVKLGDAEAESETYNLETQAPEVLLTLKGAGAGGLAMPGGTLTLCAEAQPRQGAPTKSIVLSDIVLEQGSTELQNLLWDPDEEASTATRGCHSTELPTDISFGNLEASAEVTVVDVAHNTATTPETAQLGVTRVAVALTGISGANMPLVWTDNRLAIGTSDELSGEGFVYFHNTQTGETSESPDNVGLLTGLAALGDSGRVAIAVRGDNSRVTLVNSDGSLVDASGDMDCRRGSGVAADATFPHGLILLSVGNSNGEGNWGFAAPVNETTQGRLLAYFPNGGSVSDKCRQSNAAASTWISPLAGRQDTAEVVVARSQGNDGLIRRWAWEGNSWAAGEVGTSAIQYLVGVKSIATTNLDYWLTTEWHFHGSDASGVCIRRGRYSEGTSAGIAFSEALGAMALDASGRAYVVMKLENQNQELHLYAAGASSMATPQRTATLSQDTAGPVGSPLLGAPVGASPAEAYVLMTDGTLYAFNADTLALLWTQALLDSGGQPIRVDKDAQPVLHGNRLWVISTTGELYSVLVNSDGLHKTAQWPKMYRDNCNSSNPISTSGNLPSCF